MGLNKGAGSLTSSAHMWRVCKCLYCAVPFSQNSCSCQEGQCLLLFCFDRHSASKWTVTAVILTGPCRNSCQCACAVMCWGAFSLPVQCCWDPSRDGALREASVSCLPVFKSYTRASLPPVFCSSLFPNPPLYSRKHLMELSRWKCTCPPFFMR